MKNSEVSITREDLINHLFYCRDRVETLLEGGSYHDEFSLAWVMQELGPVAVLRLLRATKHPVTVRRRIGLALHRYLLGRLRKRAPALEPKSIPDAETLRYKLRDTSCGALIFSTYTMLYLAEECFNQNVRQALAYLSLAYTDAQTLKSLEDYDVFDSKLNGTVLD